MMNRKHDDDINATIAALVSLVNNEKDQKSMFEANVEMLAKCGALKFTM